MFRHKRNKMFRMTSFFIAALSIVFLFAVTDASARPASSALHTLTQPDGYSFQAKLWGDEYYHGMETKDGYVIILDESSKTWFYAVNDSEGNLVLSRYAVGRASPPPEIEKYLRPTGEALERILGKRIKRQPLSLDGTPIREPMAPTTGTNNVLTLLINFSDTSPNVTRSDLENTFFKKDNKSVRDYYLENSYGKLTVTAGPGRVNKDGVQEMVQEWWTAPKTHDYYGADDPIKTDDLDLKLPEAVIGAVQYWDASMNFNFAPYSQSGDCYVDTVAIIVQGKPQSYTKVKNDIWPQQAELGSTEYPIYTTKTICPSGGYIKIRKYTVQTELEGDGKGATIGTFAHEYGHALGLPDLYDVSKKSSGAGNWATMGSGCDNKVTREGDSPAHHDAWSKVFLGWITPVQVTSTITGVTIPPVEDASKVYQLLPGTWGSGEYFLVENRQKKKFDSGLPGPGLLIWHIDGAVAADGQLPWNKTNSKPCNNGTSCSTQHYGVSLMQADGLWHLDQLPSEDNVEKKISNLGDVGDPFPGSKSNTFFTDSSTPNSKLYNGSSSNVSVTSITASGENIIATLSAPPLDLPSQWSWKNPLPEGNTLEKIIFGNSNTFVAVGDTGTIVTSTDGISWQQRVTGTVNDLKGGFWVGDNGNIFVVTGNTGALLGSPDGIAWKSMTSGVTQVLRGGVFSGKTLLVVGDSGTILTTSDGETFKKIDPVTTKNLYSIAYGNSTFVAVGASGAILTSADPSGNTWTVVPVVTSENLNIVTYGNNMFVAVGNSGVILTSSNGTDWTTRTSGTNNVLNDVVYWYNSSSDKGFLAVGNYGIILLSPDGTGWNPKRAGSISDPHFKGISYGNKTHVIVGSGGTIYTSTNTSAWVQRNSGTTASNLKGAAYGNNSYVSVGTSGTILCASGGSATWQQKTSGTDSMLYDVTYGNNTFAAVGDSGVILTSSDCSTWVKVAPSPTNARLYQVIYAKNMFVAVGDSGVILTSTDGNTWTPRTSGVQYMLTGITYGNNIFVAVGASGTILTSTDGANWTTRTSGVTNDLYKITYGNNTFIAVGSLGVVLTSADGTTWQKKDAVIQNSFNSIAYGSQTFVAVDQLGSAAYSSIDGITWKQRSVGTVNSLTSVAYINDAFVVLGESGTILQTPFSTICDYILSPTGKAFSTSAGSDSFSFTLSSSSSSHCTWTAAVSADASPWLSITSGSGGTGSGTVNYSVSQNTGTSARKGAIAAAGQTFRAAQAGTGESVFLSPLSGSWDLVSFPLEPANTKTPTVFKDVSNNIVVVWEFTPPNTWKSYLPKDYDPGDKSAIHDVSSNKGYWVKTKASDTLVLTGSDPVSKSIPLEADWNLAGYKKSTNTSTLTAFNDVSGNITVVWEFTPPNTWKSYLPKDYDPGDKSAIHALVPGSGYWMKMKQAVTWTLP